MENKEIERKYLLKRVPALDPDKAIDIKQYYLLLGDEYSLRIRETHQSGCDGYTMTYKQSRGNVLREEHEITIDSGTYKNILGDTFKRHGILKTVNKKRWIVTDLVPYCKEADLDMYPCEDGSNFRFLLEVEFEDPSQMIQFQLVEPKPDWIGTDVSDDPNYRAYNMNKS